VNPRIALDTNAYRALDDGNKHLAEAISVSVVIGLPMVVLGELYYGIFAGKRQADNLSTLRGFLETSRVEVLNMDEVTAKMFGEIASEFKKIGRPIQQNDLWIAALCKQYGFSLATNNAGFSNITGLEIVSF
jgi:tRNA(fMet)-specific endonuclease VapC